MIFTMSKRQMKAASTGMFLYAVYQRYEQDGVRPGTILSLHKGYDHANRTAHQNQCVGIVHLQDAMRPDGFDLSDIQVEG